MVDWLNNLAAPITETWDYARWILAVAVLTNVACALLGCYLVLRRMSLLGDAISHAVLPGLVVAVLLSGTLGIGYIFAGAFAIGLLTTFLTQTLHRIGRVPTDASMGVVFTSLFAIGVVLLKLSSEQLRAVDIDQDCVLEGALEYVPLTLVHGVGVPRQFLTIVPIAVLNLLFVVVFWKELKISSFDPALATTMGINANVMHYLLMALVALTTVASFEAVGSILVIAMLIAPPATAHLLTDRLRNMIALAVGLAALSAVLGYYLAQVWDTNIAGMIAVASGGLYGIAVLFSPRYGITSTLVRNIRTSLRIVREDFLSMLFRLEELAVDRLLGPREAIRAVGGGMIARLSFYDLLRRRQVRLTSEGVRLTDAGRQRAAKLVRSHRLWESYLVEHLGLPHDHVHDPAERVEHYISETIRDELAGQLPDTSLDPHGREIPEDERESGGEKG